MRNPKDFFRPLAVGAPDPDHSVAEKYGVWAEKSMYGRKYMGINRSHFVIDEKGKLVDVQYGVKATDSAKKSLAVLLT